MAEIFDGIAKRAVGKIAPALAGKSTPNGSAAIADNIRSTGVAVDVEERGGTIVLREHNCPYATVVAENPECCSVIHSIFDDVVSNDVKQTESLATGGRECRFEVASGNRSAVSNHGFC